MAFYSSFINHIDCKTVFFIFRGRNILIKGEETVSKNDFLAFNSQKMLEKAFYESEYNYCAAILKENASVQGEFLEMNLREYFATHNEEAIHLSSRAKGISQWRHSTRFCSFCASPLDDDKELSALYCPSCKKQIFPRIEPATITLVTRGEEILLARHATRIQNLWACLSGFIEIGETAEQCVKREIEEEVGIKVKNVTYRASQSWVFPDQLMFAFTAEYESGEIKEQESEIAEAKWFHRTALPEIPPKGSVAYNLITTYCRGK